MTKPMHSDSPPEQPSMRELFSSHDGTIAKGVYFFSEEEPLSKENTFFILSCTGWSSLDYHTVRLLCEHSSTLARHNTAVYVIDRSIDWDHHSHVYGPAYDNSDPLTPVVGYWNGADLKWVSYSFVGVKRMYDTLGLPVDELKRRLAVV